MKELLIAGDYRHGGEVISPSGMQAEKLSKITTHSPLSQRLQNVRQYKGNNL